jgi:uncharacterized protein (DUF2384 family)
MPSSEPFAQKGERSISIPAAMDAFFRLAEAWGLSTDEQIRLLGSPARSTFFKWKKEVSSLPNDTLERLSYIFGIYKALEILLPDPEQADSWIKRPNQYFNGRSALEIMMGGQVVDLYKVREYLDAQRGG